MSTTTTYNIQYDGQQRTFYLTLPSDASGVFGMIIAMHGAGGSGQVNSFADLNGPAFSQNLAVVEPSGLNNGWNIDTWWDNTGADDVGFIRAMIEYLKQNAPVTIDPMRIYACGMSNGGYMAYELTGYLWDVITAFASVTGLFRLNDNQVDDYNPPRDIPFLHIHGTSDFIIPYESPFDGSLTATNSYQYWVNHNNLTDEVIENIGQNTERFTYSSKNSAAQVVHYKVNQGGHQWDISSDFNTNEVLVNFFNQFKLSDFDTDINNDTQIDILDVVEMIKQETKYSINNIEILINKVVEQTVQ